MDYKEYHKQVEAKKEEMKQLADELKGYADHFYSSEGGRKIANQMLTAVKYFDCLPASLSNEDLRYIQAQRDFVSVFLIGLISKSTLLDILKERNNGR